MFKVIVCIDNQNGIGKSNSLPWKIKEDILFFKQKTLEIKNKNKKNCVIMGRKTYQSIPKRFRPLKNRINIVLSKSNVIEDKETENFKIFQELDDVLYFVKKNKKRIESCYVIGGSSIYKLFIEKNLINDFYINSVNKNYNCDIFFPEINLDDYKLNSSEYKVIYDYVSTRYVSFNKSIVLTFKHYIYENKYEKNYLDLMRKILYNGIEKTDRTGVGIKTIFANSLKYDIRDNKLPLLTTKNVPVRLIIEELLWMLRGSTNAKELQEKNVHIWDGNSTRKFLDERGLNNLPEGDIGAGYGHQLRFFNAEYNDCYTDYTGKGFDQLKYVIDLLKHNPASRRILFSYWNPNQLKNAALPPCHLLYQFFVNTNTDEISCCLYQRSSDYFLANNYNAISAILLTHILGNICGYKPAEFTHFMADTHIYNNHFLQCEEQLKRTPTIIPQIFVNKKDTVEEYTIEDFNIINYFPQSIIRAKMN